MASQKLTLLFGPGRTPQRSSARLAEKVCLREIAAVFCRKIDRQTAKNYGFSAAFGRAYGGLGHRYAVLQRGVCKSGALRADCGEVWKLRQR